MNFDLKRPCAECPFRRDIPGYLTGARAREIANAVLDGSTFPCHHTTETIETDDGESDCVATAESQHCAGALILARRRGRSSQLSRVAERLGYYDPSALDMESPVFISAAEMICHHSKAWRHVPRSERPITEETR